jgi:hypothetical protein
MTPRERLLAIITGSLVGIVFLFWSVNTIWGWYATKQSRIENLARDLKKKKEELLKVQLAAQRITNYEQQSLPPEVDVAQSLYGSWLVKTTQSTQLADVAITTHKPRANQRLFSTLAYTLNARGKLEQVIAWLHAFEAEQKLHRIESFTLKPVKNSKELQLVANVSALVVTSAKKTEEWISQPRPNWPELTQFQNTIMPRHFFLTANKAPQLEASTSQSATQGKSWEYKLKVNDPNALDKLRFELLNAPDKNIRLDADSGRITWTPDKLGEYAIEVQTHDDGWPAQSAKQLIKLTVSEPPPPPPPPKAEPKKLEFDAAKYTVLTGILESNGVPEVWLHIRPTNEIKKLKVGDKFEIGSIQGEVVAISEVALTFKVNDEERLLARGSMLFEATPLEN